MRAKLLGIGSSVLVLVVATASAQTPTVPPPTTTPQPTPTPGPPPHVYVSDPAIANTVTTSAQRRAAVAVGEDDNYLIVWNSDAAQPGFHDIKGQLFTRDGAKIGGEFQVDQAPAGRAEYTPSIAAGGDGNYVVVWADFDGNPSTDSEIQMRRFDAAANPLGPAVQVNTYGTGKQRLPRVAADSTGQFVVVWTSENQDGSGLGIFGRKYDETGAAVGGEFAVNTYTTGDQDRPAVDMDDGGFTVAFNDGTGGVSAREFGTFVAEGASQFAVFGANHRLPDVARLDGTNTTFYLAENTSTQGIDGVRSVNGAAQSPFPAAAHGFGPQLSHRRLRTFIAQGAPSEAVWATYWDEFFTYCQQYDLDPLGVLAEMGQAFSLFPDGQIPDIGVGPSGEFAAAAQTPELPSDIFEGHGGQPDAIAVFVLDDNGNGVIDPAEQTGISGVVLSEIDLPLAVTANASLPFAAGLTASGLTITDATADYGTLTPGAATSCQATGDCFGIVANGPRPGVHWDESLVETLSTGVHKTWTLHVGGSFGDVSASSLFYAFIENLLHNGVTGGGACGGYCPTDGVKRQQMAVFLLKSRFGPTFTPPPATGTVFADVPLSNPFASWIEALYLLGITGGCSGGPPPAPINFCPDAIVNRQQMAVFLLKTLEGSGYTPPAAAGIFQDVPQGNPFAAWIEELYARQVTGGCVASPLQYCPTNPTNRQQMAAFLVKTFGLLLYGP